MAADFHWETLPLLAGVAVVLSWIVGVGIIPSALVVGSAFPAIIFTRVVLDCILRLGITFGRLK